MENNMQACTCGVVGCKCGLITITLRLAVGAFFLLNGLYQTVGIFDGPGLQEYVDVMSKTTASLFVIYSIVLGQLIGGALLLSGIASGFGALLVLPWWIVCVFFPSIAQVMLSIDILQLFPGALFWSKTIMLCLTPILSLIIMLRGPGALSFTGGCTRMCCRLFSCHYLFCKKGCNGNS